MNFKTHQKIILENVETALSKSKVDLVSDFRTILPKAASLYKTDEFSFWIEELEKHPVSEIPMTVYGVKNAVNYLNTKEPMDRNSAVGTIAHICETLFTYQNEND